MYYKLIIKEPDKDVEPCSTKSNVDQVEYISIPEFDTVPKYMKVSIMYSSWFLLQK